MRGYEFVLINKERIDPRHTAHEPAARCHDAQARRDGAVVEARYVTEVVRSGPNWSETTSAQSWAETRLTQSVSGTFTPIAAARLTKRNETHLDPPRAEMGGG